jgi:hypothetical protein
MMEEESNVEMCECLRVGYLFLFGADATLRVYQAQAAMAEAAANERRWRSSGRRSTCSRRRRRRRRRRRERKSHKNPS